MNVTLPTPSDCFNSDVVQATRAANIYFNHEGSLKKVIKRFKSFNLKDDESSIITLECFRRAIELKKSSKHAKKAILLLDKEIKKLANPTNFITCCDQGFIEIAKKILKFNVPIWCLENTKFFTPLHYTVVKNHLEMSKWLISENATIDGPTNQLWTPLHYACFEQYNRQIALLLEAGADPNRQTIEGYTALHLACSKNNLPIVFLLMKHGADPTIANKDSKKSITLLKAQVPNESQGIGISGLSEDLQLVLLNYINNTLSFEQLVQATWVNKQWHVSINALLGRNFLQKSFNKK